MTQSEVEKDARAFATRWVPDMRDHEKLAIEYAAAISKAKAEGEAVARKDWSEHGYKIIQETLANVSSKPRIHALERAEQLRVAVEAIDEAYTVALIKDQTKTTLSRVRQALENARNRMPPLAVALCEENALRAAISEAGGKP